ncbi:MAG: aldolase/citrate lyase family protein [Candidatus Omnitrophota bacterium]|nr:aldolase/citrate lyase family protein [Candidatus Omnitrophota bacterium]
MKNFTLKQKIKNSELTIGSWITTNSPNIAEVMLKSHFDWLTIDVEHSALTIGDVQHLVRVIELSGTPALVRVGENNENLIKRVMDTGATGVIVPMVNTKEDALKAVKAAKYPPVGTRGVGLARAQGYGLEFGKYKNWVNQESIVVIQIEHIEAVNNIEDILQVPGLDAFIVGPYDLSASLGVPGEFEDPRVINALKKVIEASKRFKIPAGFHVIPPDVQAMTRKIDEGYRFVAFSLDTLILGEACQKAMAGLRKVKQ